MEETFLNELHYYKSLIDEKLIIYFKSKENLVHQFLTAIHYSISGGKRLRSILMFLVGQLFNVKPEKILIAACAVEMIHAASLIIDDLPEMDNAVMRHAKETSHIVFGSDVTLCVAFALLSKAIEIVLNESDFPLRKRIKIADILVKSFGLDGLSGGQYADLKFRQAKSNFEMMEFINKKKTCTLFIDSGRIAAFTGDAKKEELNAIEVFSEKIGFSYQLIDDLIDVKGNARKEGKDLRRDRFGFAALFGVSKACDLVNLYINEARSALGIFGGSADKLLKFTELLLNRVPK